MEDGPASAFVGWRLYFGDCWSSVSITVMATMRALCSEHTIQRIAVVGDGAPREWRLAPD